MRLQSFGLLAAAAQVTFAFSDTSPFFLFSTSEILIPSLSSNIQSASSITATLRKALRQCPSQFYVLVSQEGVHSDDFATKQTAPSLSRWVSGKDSHIRSSGSVPEVLGAVDTKQINSLLSVECGARQEDVDMKARSFPIIKSSSPRIFHVDFPATSDSAKADALLANDAFLAAFIESLPSQNYTVIYTSTPITSTSSQPEQTSYDMDSSSEQEPMHLDLKRDVSDVHARASSRNYTLPNGPLFDRYQYFTPGLFMGFLVALPLLLILYVAIRAVSSLQVSYAAFDKEMGPQAQLGKKQQ